MTFYANPQLFNYDTETAYDAIVEELMQEWEYKYCSYKSAIFYCSTFNVNGRPPPFILTDWIDVAFHDPKPDFVVIGLQEMDLDIGSFVKDNQTKKEDWVQSISRSLPPGMYKVVESARLMGIFLVIFQYIHSNLTCSNIQTNYVPTGFLKMGNKGGVGISMEINNSTVLFINSHLAAGNRETERRNQDFRDITRITFKDGKTLNDHDAVFWLGDLNYRLDTPLTQEEICYMCDTGRFKELLQYDQLNKAKEIGHVFYGYEEHKSIDFLPTYKFDVGTCRWDSSEKKRTPAWTDRILYWKKFDNVNVRQLKYHSCPNVVISDHKPVIAVFEMDIKKIWEDKMREIRVEAQKEVDKKSNDLLPQISLSATEFEFNIVKFLQPSIMNLKIKNTGQTRVKFSTTLTAEPKNDYGPYDWLTLTPYTGTVDVNHEFSVCLQVLIDKQMAWKLSPDEVSQIECIIIIHLESGRDYFISVQATYKPCCFGISLETAMLRANTFPQSDNEDSLIIFEKEVKLNIPYEVDQLLKYLRSIGFQNIDLSQPYSDNAFFKIRDCLDERRNIFEFMNSNTDIQPINIYAVLIRLLTSYKESIIPNHLKTTLLQCSDDEVYGRCILQFPEHQKDIFREILLFLKDAREVNNEFDKELETFSNIFFRMDGDTYKAERLLFIIYSINKVKPKRQRHRSILAV
uniref:IPPc domain-containing protein n=1 Tax=Strongyloides stercoralis TaxID=6248 RepID=A0A0K0E459_STRER